MATKIEKQILDITGEKPREDGESTRKYLGRLTRAANGLVETKWNTLSQEAQAWVNTNIEAINDKKDLTEFPADKAKKAAAPEPEEEEDDEDEEEDDEEEDDAPKAKKKVKVAPPDEDEEDDEEDEKIVKRESKKVEPTEDETDDEDEEEVKPRAKEKAKEAVKGAKVKKAEVKEEDAEASGEKKTGAISRLKALIIKHPTWSKAKVIEQLEKEGFTPKANTVGIAFYDVRNTLKTMLTLGVLTEDYAAKFNAAQEAKEAAKEAAKPAKKKAKPVVEDDDEDGEADDDD